STDHICYQGLQFLQADQTQPFFLYLAPGSPHAPVIPADRWDGYYQGLALPNYPNYNQIPSPNPPAHLSTSPIGQSALDSAASSFRTAIETNRAVDDLVDSVYSQLLTDGRLSNTVFIFMSDNGFGVDEHRWTGKECEFE